MVMIMFNEDDDEDSDKNEDVSALIWYILVSMGIVLIIAVCLVFSLFM
jgi:flagellar basal body-associated protein FliL